MVFCSDLEQDYVSRKATPDAGKVLQTQFLQVKKSQKNTPDTISLSEEKPIAGKSKHYKQGGSLPLPSQ